MNSKKILSYKERQLLLNDQPIQLISGAIHYFRSMPEDWVDYLAKLKACGFNTVETYLPWNLHEPEEGVYDFEGLANVEKFFEIAHSLGLYVIARPSPYICAEWEFGGLPYWLLKDHNINIRTYDKKFIEKIDAYYDVLIPKLTPFLSTNGGPIIAVQIENEYGSFGNDKQYLNYLKDSLLQRNVDVLLFTSDGPTDWMLTGGTVQDVLPTVNFGSRQEESFEMLEKHAGAVPHIVMEYWNGWFDHWKEKHHTRNVDEAVDIFKEMLYNGASVNFYMFHGGTNFGFYNGANCGEQYDPTITSYDYDAPLTEAGDITEKYIKLKNVIEEYTGIDAGPIPENSKKLAYGAVQLSQSKQLFDALNQLSSPLRSPQPLTMEKANQDYGFISYRTILPKNMGTGPIRIDRVADRAHIFINQEFKGIIDRWEQQEIDIHVGENDVQLDILVENMGRVNYGEKMFDPKGIVSGVRFKGQFIFDWEIYTLPLTNIEQLSFNQLQPLRKNEPTFYKGTLTIDEVADTFIEVPSGEKGVIFINGFNIGRYWSVGPQETYYVPSSILRKGTNEVIVFELDAEKLQTVQFTDVHRLG
ncbi:beta-galactosidase [Solibacillus sp. R5-41]|uniref:glycoside hydrolase family 35 protein n=1 Tax=Solibacillus sp. R5-41 TaxID=2048654 RepID=UPI000C128469|nr:beta-galactosidase [Solibacillus sp. R5-41]ATP40418.1 beta-galactosidase [Solibacillus sp. R5-41]